MLHLLSYLLGLLAIVSLVTCVALGLLKVCDFIEESPTRARKIGIRLSIATITLVTLITFTDGLSYTFLLASLMSQASTFYIFQNPAWPSIPSSATFIFALLCPLLAHLSILRHFHLNAQSIQQVKERRLWPGGRQDWDHDGDSVEGIGRIYGNGEALACLALCWLPALWLVLGAIAQNWTLPTSAKEIRAEVSGDGGRLWERRLGRFI